MYFEWTDFQNSDVDLTQHHQSVLPSSNRLNGDRIDESNTNHKMYSSQRSEHSGHTSSLQSLSIGEILEAPENDLMGVSAILNYCKRKILRPYLRLLASIGLRPLSLEETDTKFCFELFGFLYASFVIVLMLCGYILQYMACFRRDRGFCYISVPVLMGETKTNENYRQICYGSKTFSYIIPSVLHLTAYLYSLYLFRISNNEQLQSMMERVFLLSSGPYDGSTGQRNLLKTLWVFIGSSITWIILSLITMIIMIEEGNITFQWIQTSSLLISGMKILMIFCTMLHDMVQTTIICGYCIHAQLLKSHLHFLKVRLMQQFLTPLEWMREISEFRKSLSYLNDKLAPAVCIFTITNLSWALSGVLWLMGLDTMDIETQTIYVVSLLNVILWLIISLAPFIQASRLTANCLLMQTVGHDVRTRPLAYQSTPAAELDSILLYASSLRLNAKLFKVPITGRCLYLSITVLGVLILTLGQCHYFQIPE